MRAMKAQFDPAKRLRSRNGVVLSILCLAGIICWKILAELFPEFAQSVKETFLTRPELLVGGLVSVRLLHLGLIALRTRRLCRVREAIDGDPTQPASHLDLAAGYHRKGELELAVHSFRNAIQLDPDLDIEHRRATAQAMVERYAASRRDARWIREMTRLASMDYLIEKADRSPVKVRETVEPSRTRLRDRRQLTRQCQASIESVKLELSGLELFRRSLRQFVSGYQYYEDRALLDEEIRSLRDHLDQLEAILRDLEDA